MARRVLLGSRQQRRGQACQADVQGMQQTEKRLYRSRKGSSRNFSHRIPGPACIALTSLECLAILLSCQCFAKTANFRPPFMRMLKISNTPRLTVLMALTTLAWAQRPDSKRPREVGYPLPAHGRHGMVASSDRIASSVGLDVLKRGGNAVDAAVAVALALAVTHPSAGNLGGGGFMLIRMADGRAVAIDYRETGPQKASHDMYLGPDGKLVPQL